MSHSGNARCCKETLYVDNDVSGWVKLLQASEVGLQVKRSVWSRLEGVTLEEKCPSTTVKNCGKRVVFHG
jgi:hypothetical protein